MTSRDNVRLIVQCGKCGKVDTRLLLNTTDRIGWVCDRCGEMNTAETGGKVERMVRELVRERAR